MDRSEKNDRHHQKGEIDVGSRPHDDAERVVEERGSGPLDEAALAQQGIHHASRPSTSSQATLRTRRW